MSKPAPEWPEVDRSQQERTHPPCLAVPFNSINQNLKTCENSILLRCYTEGLQPPMSRRMLARFLRSSIRLISPDGSPQTQGVKETVVPDQSWVIRVLLKHDGRMWQGKLIEETGWSASKMSRTLSKMETEGRITRYRIGREKLVTLPQHPQSSLQRTLRQADPGHTRVHRPDSPLSEYARNSSSTPDTTGNHQ